MGNHLSVYVDDMRAPFGRMVSLGKRELAVRHGAVEISWKELGRMVAERRRAAVSTSPPNPRPQS